MKKKQLKKILEGLRMKERVFEKNDFDFEDYPKNSGSEKIGFNEATQEINQKIDKAIKTNVA